MKYTEGKRQVKNIKISKCKYLILFLLLLESKAVQYLKQKSLGWIQVRRRNYSTAKTWCSQQYVLMRMIKESQVLEQKYENQSKKQSLPRS